MRHQAQRSRSRRRSPVSGCRGSPARPASARRSNSGRGSEPRPEFETGRQSQSGAGSSRSVGTCSAICRVRSVRPTCLRPDRPPRSPAIAGISATADFGRDRRRLWSMLRGPRIHLKSIRRPLSRRTFRRRRATGWRCDPNSPPSIGNVVSAALQRNGIAHLIHGEPSATAAGFQVRPDGGLRSRPARSQSVIDGGPKIGPARHRTPTSLRWPETEGNAICHCRAGWRQPSPKPL